MADLIAMGEASENEDKIHQYLVKNLPSDFLVVSNLRLNDTIEIDDIVIGPTGVVVVEIKNWSGQLTTRRETLKDQAGNVKTVIQWIFGDGQVASNPLDQASVHANIIKSYLKKYDRDFDRIFVRSCVCFSAETMPKIKGIDDNRRNSLLHYKNVIPFIQKGTKNKPISPLMLGALKAALVNRIFTPKRLEDDVKNEYEIQVGLWSGFDSRYLRARTNLYPYDLLLQIIKVESDAAASDYNAARPYLELIKRNQQTVQQILDTGDRTSGGQEHVARFYHTPFYSRYLRSVVCPIEWVNGNLLSRLLEIRKLDFKEKCHLAWQLCRGLTFIHSAKIAHRNLHPGNIVVDDKNQVKILNFYFAKFLGNMSARTVRVDSPAYRVIIEAERNRLSRYVDPYLVMDPDTQEPQDRHSDANENSDLYSLGVILWELFTEKEYPGSGNIAAEALNGLELVDVMIQSLLACRSSQAPNSDLLKKCEETFRRLHYQDEQQDYSLPALEPGEDFMGWVIERTLSSSAMSIVYQAHGKVIEDDRVVVKFIRATGELAASEVHNCYTIMKQMDAESTARWISGGTVFVNDGRVVDNDTPCHEVYFYIQEYISGKTLKSYLAMGLPDRKTVLELFWGILQAFRSLHLAGWTHQDIKPDNIMVSILGDEPNMESQIVDVGLEETRISNPISLTRNSVKIIDYGLSQRIENATGIRAYSHGYTPRDVLPVKEGGNGYPWLPCDDVYSIARTLIAIVCGEKQDRKNGPVFKLDFVEEYLGADLRSFLEENASEDRHKRCSNPAELEKRFQEIMSALIEYDQVPSPLMGDEKQEIEPILKSVMDLPDLQLDPEPEIVEPVGHNFHQSLHPVKQGPELPMTTNLIDLLKQVETTLQKMGDHIELKSFDRQVMKFWIDIHDSKEEIDEDDRLRGEYEKVRSQIAQILQNQFDLALRQIEQADDETAFSKGKSDATEWQGMFSNVDQSTIDSSPKLEKYINRYRLFEDCFKKYTALTHSLAEEVTPKNISGLRTEISSLLENLNKAILTLQSDLQLDQQEHDRRIDLFEKWIKEIEENRTVRQVFEVSNTMTIQVSGNYAAGMDDLKNKDPDSMVYHYISDDPVDPVMDWNKVKDVIVIWDRRWKRYSSQKIQQYAQDLLNSGLNATGPFSVDPFEWKERFSNLVDHIKRPIADLDDQTREEHKVINDRIKQAITNFKPLRDHFEGVRELIKTDDQRDPLDLLVELDRVWAIIGEQVPLYAIAYDDLRANLIPRVKNHLKQRYASYRKLFFSNPLAVKRAARDVVSKLKQFTEFETNRFDIERLINLCELFEKEMNEANGELPDRALARLEALQVTIENEMGTVPLLLMTEIQTRQAGLKPVKVGQELKARATELLGNLENQAANRPLEQLVNTYSTQIELVLKQMEVTLPELSKQPPTNTALLPIYDSLVNSQRALKTWSAYLQAAVEIERPGANLSQINNWLDVVRESAYRKDLFTKIGDIVSRVAGFGANDGVVAAIVEQINTTLAKTTDDYQNLTQDTVSRLMNLWTQLDAVRALSTTRTSERRSARAALEQKILRIAMNLMALLHEGVTKVSLKDLELIVKWMQKYQATHASLKEMEAHLYALQALSYLKPDHGEPNLNAAISAWKQARERNHPHAEAMLRALKKMKALVDAAKGVHIFLASANTDQTLKYDTDVIACTLQSKLLKIINEYENIAYLSGRVTTVTIVGEAKVVPFPLIEDFHTDYGNITNVGGDIPSDALDTQYQVMWDQYHLSDVMKCMNVIMPPAPAMIYDEFLFRSQTYKDLASLITRMVQSETLMQLQRICFHDAPPLVNNVNLKTRHAELLKHITILDNLATDLWFRGRSAYEQGLVAPVDELTDPHKNDYRRMILTPDAICPANGGINRIHQLQIWLANSITHFENKRTIFVSENYVIGLNADSVGRHYGDLSSILEQAKDLHAILPHFLTLYFARLKLDDTAWETHPLGTILIDLTNFIQNQDLNVFLTRLKGLHTLYQNVREKQNSGLLLALGKEADKELNILTNQIAVIKGWNNPIGYVDLTHHPSFVEIEQQVNACAQKRMEILNLLAHLKEAGNVAGVPGGTLPTDVEIKNFAASGCKDPLEWANSLLQRLEEAAPDPLKTPLWRWSLIYGNMTEEAAIKKYVAAERTVVKEIKTYLDNLKNRVNEQLKTRVDEQVGSDTGDLLNRAQQKISTNGAEICAWLLQAKYKEAFDEWVSQVGLEFDLPDEQLPVNGGGVEQAKRFGVCAVPLVKWLQSLNNWNDIRAAVDRINTASQSVPYTPMKGVCITQKKLEGRGMFSLFADLAKQEAEFHEYLHHTQTASTYRNSLISQEWGVFNALPQWTLQAKNDLARVASLYEDYEDAHEKAWSDWRDMRSIRVPRLDIKNQGKEKLKQAKERLQSRACVVCRLAPLNVTFREQLMLECSRFADPRKDNPCGQFTLDGRLQ